MRLGKFAPSAPGERIAAWASVSGMTPDRHELAGKLEVANRCPKTWGTISSRHREDDNVLNARHRYTRVVIASGMSRVTDAPIDGDEDVGVDKARGSGSSDQPRDGRGTASLTFVGAEEVDVSGGLDLPPGWPKMDSGSRKELLRLRHAQWRCLLRAASTDHERGHQEHYRNHPRP